MPQLPLDGSPTLGEYISQLQALEQQHGSKVRVQRWTGFEGRQAAPAPQVAYAWVPPEGKQVSSGRFWNVHDAPAEQGEVLIRV